METEPWFKLQLKTPDKRQVFMMAAALKKDADLVLGKLIRWWCWLDLHTVDSHTGMTPENVDMMLHCKNFSSALIASGWASLAADGTVDVVRWGEHNGETSKQRALTARRVAKHKAKKSNAASVTENAENGGGGNAGSVTFPLPQRYLEKEYNNNKEVSRAMLHSEPPEAVSHAPLASSSSSVLPEGFLSWLGALGPAHPSLRQSERLHPAVQAAALAAFERCPRAAEKAELLAAFLADGLREDRYGNKFYRPGGQERFFETLEDTITSAEKWDKETGWSRGRKRKSDKTPQISHRMPPSCPREASGGQMATLEEQAAFLREIRSMVDEPQFSVDSTPRQV